ncbi:MAG: NAD(P)-dependent oxidoreductase [Candidatus Bathyarchaeia archaeon]
MSLLVLGGAGFISSYFIAKALKSNIFEKVIVYDHDIKNNTLSIPLFKDLLKENNLILIEGNVLNSTKLFETIRKFEVDQMVHTISLLTKASQEDPMSALDLNIKSLIIALEAARIFDFKKIIYTSSQAVYGYTEEKIIDEEYPKNPNTMYAITKFCGELIGLNYKEEHGINFICLRFPLVYGYGRRRGYGIIEELIEKPLLGEVPIVQGNQKFEPLYVKDAAKSILLSLISSKIRHNIFNIGSVEMLTYEEMINIIRRVIPGASVKIVEIKDNIRTKAYCTRGPLNFKKAQEELGYYPEYNFEKGIKDYLEIRSICSHS